MFNTIQRNHLPVPRKWNRPIWNLFLVSFLIQRTLMSGAIHAEESSSRQIGIFIGVNNYDLRYAAEDARRQAQIFGEQFRYETSVFATGLKDDADKRYWSPTLSNLRTHIPRILKAASPSDTVIVSFSGHGILDADEAGYLVPQDAELDSLIETSLPLEWLRQTLRNCRADTKLILLDCCHAGAEKGIGVRPGVSSSVATGGDFARSLRDEPGLMTIASCRSNQKSYELQMKGQGLFTHFLIEGLMDGADLPPKDRKVTVTELYGYVMRNVSDYAFRKLNEDQIPVLVLDKAGVLEESTIAKWSDPKLQLVAELTGHESNSKALPAISVSANGDYAAYVPQFSGAVKAHPPIVWDLMRGRILSRLNGAGGPQYSGFGSSCIAISNSGRRVASEGHWGTFWWDTSAPKTTRKLIGTRDRFSTSGIAFSGNEKFLATAHTSGQVFVWDLELRKQKATFNGGVLTPRFSPDDSRLAVATADLSVNEWKLDASGFPRRFAFDAALPRTATITVKYGRQQETKLLVRDLSYTSDGKKLMAIAGVRGLPFHICVWDAQTGKIIQQVKVGRNPSAAAIAPNHSHVFLGDADGTVGIWDVASGKAIYSTRGHSKAVDGIAVSADGRTIVSGGQDMKVFVYRMEN